MVVWLEVELCDGFGGGLGGVDVDAVASSKASNGVESSLWLAGWACAFGGGAADGAFGAILCTLGTGKLPQATYDFGCHAGLQCPGHAAVRK